MHTGISDDSGSAFWLADDRKTVVTFNTADSPGLQKLDLPKVLHSVRTYLGKIYDDKIGVVASFGSIVTLYGLENGQGYSWKNYKLLGMIKAGIMDHHHSASLMRFDKDVYMQVGRRSLLWEMSSNVPC
ncbi:uncharacterized protein A4U43_C03F26600 [Asparagus officinalis]|uniref:Uncharacterized protein n=1 Tax=Asparagus officinalis TaxID=4686 RepID=A0A5P1FF36_ASPOF|nr:uncharacterized protein A4U43_C03F26600 [Asparagus officinalis]